jgi:hypothetical protein
MPTLIYTPGVQVIIESTKAVDPVTKRRATEAKPVLLDVSADLVEGTMVRRSDAPSTFDFSLQNQGRKYDNLFSPNDRLYVMMKRVTWMRVYTGYVNSSPFFTAWPRVVPISSSCSLKRLQYFYWDSTLSTSRQLIVDHMFGGAQKYAPDGGIKNAAKALLETVVGWPASKVHIAQVPRDWLNFAVEIAKEVVDDANAANAEVQKIAQALGIGPSVAGATDGASAYGQAPPDNIDPTTGKPIPGTGALPATSGRATFFTGRMNGLTDTSAVGHFALTGESALSAVNIPGTNFYCAMRWPYADKDADGGSGAKNAPGVSKKDRQKAMNWWKNKRIIVSNPLAQTAVVVRAVDYGPNTNNKDAAVIDLSPAALTALLPQGSKDTSLANVNIAFADQSMPLGPVSVAALGAVGANDSGNFNGQLSGQVGPQGTGVATAYDFVRKGLALITNAKVRYSQGGNRKVDITSDIPSTLDCSEFVFWCYWHATGRLPPPYGSNTDAIAHLCRQNANGSAEISVGTALRTRGALLFADHGHVEVSLGDGSTSIGAFHTGTHAGFHYGNKVSGWDRGFLLPFIDYTGAGLTGETPVGTAPNRTGYDPNSNDPHRNGDLPPRPGQLQAEAAARATQDFSTAPGTLTDVDPASGSPIDSIFNNTSWQPIQDAGANAMSETLNGARALLNDEPIFPYIKALMNSSLRSFCSAPNGDFMAWFPDYYGLWGTAAIMSIEPIELVDFTVMWSDDYFVTHQFVTQAYQSNFDTGTGDLSGVIHSPEVTTVGIASIDIKAIMRALFGLEFTDDMYDSFVNTVYKRFGPRPDYQPLNGIFGPKGEFFMALFLFMRQWAYQYNANVDLTFMPELYPGMLMRIPAYNFQAYVVAVTHSFRFGEGGGFTTQVNIASPARLGAGRDLMAGLPLAGNFKQAIRTADPYYDPTLGVPHGAIMPEDRQRERNGV